MNLNSFLEVGLISSPIILIFFRILKVDKTPINWEKYLMHLFIPLAAVIVAYFIFQMNPLWAIILYLFIILSQTSLAFDSILNNDNRWIPVSASQLFALIVFISLRFTVWNSSQDLREVDVTSIDLSEIDESFGKIQQKLNELDNQINNETSNLEIIIREIKEAIAFKNDEISKLDNQQNELKEQLEYYKELSNISEKQSEMLIKALNKNKYFDYLFGFFVGIISSFLASLLFERLKETTTNTLSIPSS